MLCCTVVTDAAAVCCYTNMYCTIYYLCIMLMLYNCILLNNMVVAITQEDLYLHDYCSTTLLLLIPLQCSTTQYVYSSV